MLKKFISGYLILLIISGVIAMISFLIEGEIAMIFQTILIEIILIVILKLMNNKKNRNSNTSGENIQEKPQNPTAMPNTPVNNNQVHNNTFNYEEETKKQMELSDMYYQHHLNQLKTLNFNNVMVNYNSDVRLSALEISFLKYIVGMDVNNLNIAVYWTHEYGIQYQEVITKFIANDYLSISSIKQLESFIVDELKDMLRKSNLKVSGRKDELINRLKTELHPQQLQSLTSCGSWYFLLTKKGEYYANLVKKSITKDLDFEDYCLNLIMQCKFEEAYSTIQYYEQNKPISRMQGKDCSRNKLSKKTVDNMFKFWNKQLYLPTNDQSVILKFKASFILSDMLGKKNGIYDLFIRLSGMTDLQDEYMDIIDTLDINNIDNNETSFKSTLSYDENENKPLKSNQILSGKMKHVAGLPVPTDTLCEILSLPETYNFQVNKSEFHLDKSRVINLCIKKDVEIQKQYVSSIGGAVGGALVFGALGAIVCGRAKQKTTKTSTSYLIFTYSKNDSLEYLSFEIPKISLTAIAFVTEFKTNSDINKPMTKFEL